MSWVLEYAEGSPGLAETALANRLHAWHGALEPLLAGLDRGRFEPELGGTCSGLIEQQAAGVVEANDLASKDGANKAWSRRLIAMLSERYRRKLRVAGSTPEAERAVSAIDALREAEMEIGSNVNMKLVLEKLAASIAREPASL
jgi:hypothetical protein